MKLQLSDCNFRGSGRDVFLWVLQKKLLDALSSGTALDFPKIVSIAICSNSPVLNGRLTFGEDNSRHHVSSWNLPFFWDNPGVNVRYLLNFQVGHTFYKLDVKILATRNKSRCVRCSSPPSSSWAVDLCQ